MEKSNSLTRAQKPRLMFLIGELGLGGSERQLYLLLKHLDREKNECHVVVFNPGNPYLDLKETLQNMGVQVWPVPGNFRSIYRRFLFLFRLFRQLKPAVIHSWTVNDNPYAGLAGWLAGTDKRFGSLRGSLQSPGFLNMPWLFRFLSLYGVQKIVVNSAEVAAQLHAKGYPPRRIFVLPNCVEKCTDLLQPPNLSDFGISSTDRLVGIVGNLRPVKNHFMFIDGMARVIARHPDVRGIIVGQPLATEPDMFNNLVAHIHDLGLEGKILLTGFRQDVTQLMQCFRVFCLTSHSESMPNVILEAMMSACPVVATAVGAIPDLIQDGVNGFLVKPGDVDSFASAVDRLLSDPKLSRKMGLLGRDIAESEYGCNQAVQSLLEFYTV